MFKKNIEIIMYNKSAHIKNSIGMEICLTAVHKVLICHDEKILAEVKAGEGAAFCFSPGKRKVSKHGIKNYSICQCEPSEWLIFFTNSKNNLKF
ncbi:hypothetical protein [Propionispira arboris]|uniref:hypothetical protein n=1 Tax=Propionispira arboris TaxID=84035 RepID=UPI000B8099DB|nr:hypothetical protein [Propionispira arboris]